jgi:hypothetical protein
VDGLVDEGSEGGHFSSLTRTQARDDMTLFTALVPPPNAAGIQPPTNPHPPTFSDITNAKEYAERLSHSKSKASLLILHLMLIMIITVIGCRDRHEMAQQNNTIMKLLWQTALRV